MVTCSFWVGSLMPASRWDEAKFSIYFTKSGWCVLRMVKIKSRSFFDLGLVQCSGMNLVQTGSSQQLCNPKLILSSCQRSTGTYLASAILRAFFFPVRRSKKYFLFIVCLGGKRYSPIRVEEILWWNGDLPSLVQIFTASLIHLIFSLKIT